MQWAEIRGDNRNNLITSANGLIMNRERESEREKERERDLPLFQLN